MPVYNGAEYLAEALESALAQRYEPFEVVVADDGSTDGSEAICRRFAEADPRVRYLRVETNGGAVANFCRVLREARGTYFTWLAQDDVLSEPEYVSTMVAYLEAHPDVVNCASGLLILDLESPGSQAQRRVPELAPERPWPDARREFFHWPQGNVLCALYGMYRRADLLQVPIVGRTYKGRPNAAYWEIPVLAALCGHGRIVALPECPRTYRVSGISDGDRIRRGASLWDLFAFSIGVKLMLIRIAWQLEIPPLEKLDLLRVTLANLFRGNLSRPWDHQAIVREREREYALLWSTLDERSRLIGSLRTEIEKRREILRLHGQDSGAHANAHADRPDVLAPPFPRRQPRSRGFLAELFRPPAPWQLLHYRALTEEIGVLRRHCEAQLGEIERLHAEAEALLRAIDDASPVGHRPHA